MQCSLTHPFFSYLFWYSLAIFCIGSYPLGSVAEVKTNPPELTTLAITQLAPDLKHQRLDKTIIRLLSNYHYRQEQLNDALSIRIFESYLQTLDPNRSYFLASDISRFNKYRTMLDNHLLVGNSQPAYEIFNRYRQRVVERTERIFQQLKAAVDFNIDESLELDRKNAPWAANVAELDELWRKRLKNELLSLVVSGQSLEEARTTLEKRYRANWRRIAQYTSDDVFQTYINAVAQTFDPHTSYFTPRASENFNIHMRLSLEGIGSVLRMEDERVTIVELVPGGPAAASKAIKVRDRIIAVAQGDDAPLVDIIGWRLDDVVDLIRGPRGTVVRLQIVPAESGAHEVGHIVRLVRDTIKLEQKAASSRVTTLSVEGQSLKLGIITIPTFYSDFAAAARGDPNYRSTSRDVRQLLLDLQQQHVQGIVIDLRQNGGGSLQEAVEVTGLFIKTGPVVQVRSANGGVEIENDVDSDIVYEGPLAVLVDRHSASASEIFAAAIQDYGRGLIIGNPTYGKGTVQTLLDLNQFINNPKVPSGQLKLTVAKFYRINGSSTQHRGVIPDIAFPSAFGRDEVGESAQDFALPWDEIAPLKYPRSNHIVQLLPELNQRYHRRLSTDETFKAFAKEIELARQERLQTRVSLLKKKRQSQWNEQQARLKQRGNRYRIIDELEPADESFSSRSDSDAPDLLLDESTRILADLVILSGDANPVAFTGR